MGVAWIGLWVWPGLADGCGLDWHVGVTWLACGCDLDRHVGVAWVGICVWPELAYGWYECHVKMVGVFLCAAATLVDAIVGTLMIYKCSV